MLVTKRDGKRKVAACLVRFGVCLLIGDEIATFRNFLECAPVNGLGHNHIPPTSSELCHVLKECAANHTNNKCSFACMLRRGL